MPLSQVIRRPRLFSLAATALAVLLPLASAHAQAPPPPRYYLVFLRPDPARTRLPQEEADRIQTAHMANIHRMAEDGILVAAGPFDDQPTTISGLFLFKIGSQEEAQTLAAQDPTVAAHRNTVEVHGWSGPEGIGVEYVRLHKQDPATPENMQMHPLFLVHHGPDWEAKAPEREAILKEHSAYIAVLRQQHKVGAAGRLAPSGDLFGLVIFQALPLDEARQLVDADPATKAGILRYEPHQWWSADHVLPQ